MARYRVGVVSRNHVKIGEAGGFCQLCHGKSWQVKRMLPGDWLIYYSPREGIKEGRTLQSFTAIGRIKPGSPYQFTMDNGFTPTRRDVEYYTDAVEVPIQPLLHELSFSANNPAWGLVLRRGVFEIPEADFLLIAGAMGVAADAKLMAV
ncbi:MAG: EVE domain-containing protein [Cohaesibacteraceae bacterium]|nr:EVE domain-containing protein [Cohaesibacteraceae bacterium]